MTEERLDYIERNKNNLHLLIEAADELIAEVRRQREAIRQLEKDRDWWRSYVHNLTVRGNSG